MHDCSVKFAFAIARKGDSLSLDLLVTVPAGDECRLTLGRV